MIPGVVVGVGVAMAAALALSVVTIRQQAVALGEAGQEADGLRTAITALRTNYENSTKASAEHRRTVAQVRARYEQAQQLVGSTADGCLDTDLGPELRSLYDYPGSGAPAADAPGAAR